METGLTVDRGSSASHAARTGCSPLNDSRDNSSDFSVHRRMPSLILTAVERAKQGVPSKTVAGCDNPVQSGCEKRVSPVRLSSHAPVCRKIYKEITEGGARG